MDTIKPAYKWNRQPEKRTNTKFCIIHHAKATNATVEDIHRWHQENGWAGAGYHLYIRKDCSIYEMRPLETIGAHTLGFNNDSIGICLEGDFEVEQISIEQKEKLIDVMIHISDIYPDIVFGRHRDFSATKCPGDIDWDYILTTVEKRRTNKKEDDILSRIEKLEKNVDRIIKVIEQRLK